MLGNGKRVLLVSHLDTIRQSLAETIEEDGFIVVQAQDGIRALCEMQLHHFDAVVTDDCMPRLDGLDLLSQCRRAWPETPVILFAELDWDRGDTAKARGAFAWIRKSTYPGVLLSVLTLAVAQGVGWRAVQAMEEVGA